MNMKRTILALSMLATGALSAAAQDTIFWKGERQATKGTVVSINFLQIKYRLEGAAGEQEDNARDVKDIEFDPDNSTLPYYEFDQGMRALHKGQQKEAVEQFTRALDRIKGSNTPNHPMRDFCRKHILEANLMARDSDATVASARALRKERPDSFFLRDSFMMQYDAAKMKRDTALLNDTIRELEEAIKADRRYAEQLQKDADLLKADVLEMNKKYDEAFRVYSKLGGVPEAWEEVNLGLLRCMSALGKTADLKAKVESLLVELKEKRDAHPRVYLGTMVARGDVFLAEGKFKEALLDYMKGALDPGQAANTGEHETALARSAIAASKYARWFGEKDKSNKMLYIDRAKEMREELTRTFPQTSFTAEVDAAINDAIRSQ